MLAPSSVSPVLVVPLLHPSVEQRCHCWQRRNWPRPIAEACLARRPAWPDTVSGGVPGTPGMTPVRKPFPLACHPSKCSPPSQPFRVTAVVAPSPLVRSFLRRFHIQQAGRGPDFVCELSPASRLCSVRESVAASSRFQSDAARYFLGLMVRQVACPWGASPGRGSHRLPKELLVCRRSPSCEFLCRLVASLSTWALTSAS